jgi:hypothetical protein
MHVEHNSLLVRNHQMVLNLMIHIDPSGARAHLLQYIYPLHEAMLDLLVCVTFSRSESGQLRTGLGHGHRGRIGRIT